jgi:16S rRNA (cytosine967-C5)-methyltransferase
MKQWSYINTSVHLLAAYDGREPFASYLRKYFSENKKYGSRDRKQIAHLCYCYFRLGRAGLELKVEDRILLALFLCSQHPHDVLEQLKPEWNEKLMLSPYEKLDMAGARFLINDIMPWKEHLSRGADPEKMDLSFLNQPNLFIRVRPGKEITVTGKLHQAGISFHEFSPSCIILPPNSKLEEVLKINEEVIIQDYNSQRTGEFFPVIRQSPQETVWDCCAASGGKSIMLYDRYPNIDLWVSDIRESILANLRQRFKEAGIRSYKSFIADLANKPASPDLPPPDLIIADVPCTGSGTWSRTPEQLFYFKEEKIAVYAQLQQKIVSAVTARLKPGGHLLYITCSIFREENEACIDFMQEQLQLQLLKKELLTGYDHRADTLFVALLQKAS